jgi:hypothetical protein
MALSFNGTNIPVSSNVNYNGTNCSTVSCNGTQVWKHAPEWLYNSGNQYTEFTGGWNAQAAYYLGGAAGTNYYRNQTASTPVFNATNIQVSCIGNYLGGGSVITNWPVDLTGISSITANINVFDQYETYSYFYIHILSAWPTINADNNSIAATVTKGNQQATSLTLNVSSLNGSYYVLVGFSNNNYRTFTGYVYSIKCNF